MPYDAEAAACANPQPGDYWSEHFCPYFIVVAADGEQDQYTILSALGPDSARVDNGDGTWSFDYDRTQKVNRAWIESRVKYQKIPGFVAEVSRSDRGQRLLKEWRQHQAQRLLSELKALGPEVSQMILTAEW